MRSAPLARLWPRTGAEARDPAHQEAQSEEPDENASTLPRPPCKATTPPIKHAVTASSSTAS